MISKEYEHIGYVDLFHVYLRALISILFNADDSEMLTILPNSILD